MRFAQEPHVADDGGAKPDRCRRHVGIDSAAGGVEVSLGSKGVDQFGHVERVSAGARDQRLKARTRWQSESILHEVGDRVLVERSESHMECAVTQRGVDEPVQRVVSGERPKGHDERHGHIAEVAGGEAQGGDRRRVSPLKIVDSEDQRLLERQQFEALAEALDDPELWRRLVDQPSDLGGQWIRRRSTAVERVDQRPEWPPAVELVGTGVNHSDTGSLGKDLGEEPRLADPGLALEQDDLAATAEALANRAELTRPSEEVPASTLSLVCRDPRVLPPQRSAPDQRRLLWPMGLIASVRQQLQDAEQTEPADERLFLDRRRPFHFADAAGPPLGRVEPAERHFDADVDVTSLTTAKPRRHRTRARGLHLRPRARAIARSRDVSGSPSQQPWTTATRGSRRLVP